MRSIFAGLLLLCAAASVAGDNAQELHGIWLMGQSLCEGAESLPIVTAEPTVQGAWRFRRGVRTWIATDNPASPEKRPAGDFDLVPLNAQMYGALGETVANGLADHLRAALLRSNASAPEFLVSYAGQGGRMIDELSAVDQSTDARTPADRRHGGGYYRTSLDDVRRAREQAAALGKRFRVGALYWMQGEGNGGAGGGIRPSRWDSEMPLVEGREWYCARLIDYLRRFSADVGEPVPMFTYQTLGPAGAAQLLAADRDPLIYMVGPIYPLPSALNSRRPRIPADAIHLAADGERWYGEQTGKVMRRVVYGHERWQPLRPKGVRLTRDRSGILIEFTAPRPPLVLDTQFLPPQGSAGAGGYASRYGFQVTDSRGQVLPLRDVSLEGKERVRLRLAAKLPKGQTCRVRYGLPWTGSFGTITSVREGSPLDDQPTTELLVEGAPAHVLGPLADEGAFILTNSLPGDRLSRAPVKVVAVRNGKAALSFPNRELKGPPFEAGQAIQAYRSYPFGNLRDSDAEESVYTYADTAYGHRAGRRYPLWNWCVTFTDLPVSE